MSYIKVLLLVIVLSGCAERGFMQQWSAERDIDRYGSYCEHLGFKADTDQWRSCIQNQTTNRAMRSR